MSKQVERQGDNLIVRTREDYKSASKVIVMRKGETAKVFYPVLPSVITNLDDVKDWNICGYSVAELVKVALILREKGVEEFDIRYYNQTYIAGYKKAYEEINKQIEESVNRIINGAQQ